MWARKEPPQSQRQGSLFCSHTAGQLCLMLQLPWQLALWRLVQLGRTTLLLEGGGRSCTPVPPPDAARANRHRHPPSPSSPLLIPAPCHPGCAGGKNPKEVPGSSEADAPAQLGDHGDSTSSQASGHSVNPAWEDPFGAPCHITPSFSR